MTHTSIQTAVQIENLTKSYPDSTANSEALRNLSLDIPNGAVVGFVGENGAGKSTLLNTIAGMIQPTSGKVSVFGQDPWHFTEATKQRIGFVPQKIRYYDWMTVKSLIDFCASFYPNWCQPLADGLIAEWDLPLGSTVKSATPGQQQKIATLLATAHQPELLILDEPAASLDPVARRKFIKVLVDMTLDENRTVLLSTHLTQDLERLASHVAFMRDGEVLIFDELDAIQEHVKKLVIQFSGDLQNVEKELNDVFHLQREPGQITCCHPRFSSEVISNLEKNHGADVSVVDLNLEEIFLELNQ